ncbi:MAG TPA: tetratricopeptide repeat protein, partial [Chitinophagales bacterium]|nr:tetratricopeptide repeat protein [Chitinophagales bacterium]
VTSYEYAIDADPKNAYAYMKIGQIYMSAKNYELAHEHFKKGNQADPDFIPLYRELAEFNYLAKRFDDAIRFQKEYMDRSGSDVEKLSTYAKYLFMNKDYENTIMIIEDVMRQDSSNVILSRLIGYSYYEQGKYPEGLAYMKRFFAQADTSKIIGSDYAYYGKLLAKTGEDSLAIIYLNKAITLDSTNADLYFDLGMTYYSQKKNTEAAATLEKMLLYKKGTSQDYFLLGRAYYWGGVDFIKLAEETKDKTEKTKFESEAAKSFAKADTAFLKVTELQPVSPTGYLWRARCNSQLDPESEKGLALPHYLKFIELATDETKYKKDLLEAYSYLGYYYAIITENMADAKKSWAKVQQLEPDNPKAKEFFKQLNTPQTPPKN